MPRLRYDSKFGGRNQKTQKGLTSIVSNVVRLITLPLDLRICDHEESSRTDTLEQVARRSGLRFVCCTFSDSPQCDCQRRATSHFYGLGMFAIKTANLISMIRSYNI